MDFLCFPENIYFDVIEIKKYYFDFSNDSAKAPYNVHMPSVFPVQTVAGTNLDSTHEILDPFISSH